MKNTSMSLTLMWRSNDQQWVTGQNSILCQSKSLRYPFWKQVKGYVTEVTVGSTKGATVPVQIGKSRCNASKSVMSEEYF